MAQDSMRHYPNCPEVALLARTRLGITAAPFEERLGDFLLMSRHSDSTSLVMRAVRIYATFLATNAVRHGRVSKARDAWIQAVVDVTGHAYPLRRMWSSIW